jgi:hypothetical protein
VARCGHHYPIQECAICFEDREAAYARLEAEVIQWEERAFEFARERDEAREKLKHHVWALFWFDGVNWRKLDRDNLAGIDPKALALLPFPGMTVDAAVALSPEKPPTG